jgi:hypothetical protein
LNVFLGIAPDMFPVASWLERIGGSVAAIDGF